jgi:hypothetical protein
LRAQRGQRISLLGGDLAVHQWLSLLGGRSASLPDHLLIRRRRCAYFLNPRGLTAASSGPSHNSALLRGRAESLRPRRMVGGSVRPLTRGVRGRAHMTIWHSGHTRGTLCPCDPVSSGIRPRTQRIGVSTVSPL